MQYNITTRKKDNGVQYIISYKDSTGKWKQKSKQGFKGVREAKDAAATALDELKKDLENNTHINHDYDGITFEEFTKMYMNHLRIHREFNTYKNYNNALNQFPDLKDILVKEIKNTDIQDCVDKLVERKLKPTTIAFYLKRLSNTLDAAVEQYNIIGKSPLKNIKVPEDKEAPNKKALTLPEYYKLLDDFKDSPYYIIVLLAGSCGLRISELLGLTWDCVDFENKIIIVNKQWKRDKTGKYDFGTLKSKNSYRKVPLPSEVITKLKKYQENSYTDATNRVILYNSTEAVISNLNRIFKRNNCGITIHELRHTYATNLIANGIDFKTTANILGHDVKQTMQTYSHVTDDMFKNASEKIESIFK